MPSSWVLHCGSQFKTPGQSNVDFDLNLNQTLEFPDETKCSIMNLCIPTSVPNVLDSFDNRTWKFKFRMYAMNAALTRTGAVTGIAPYHSYDPSTTCSSALLHSEYEMSVPIPEGSYQQSDAELNFTESTNIPQRADNAFPQRDLGSVAATTAVAVDNNAVANCITYSQMLIAGHRYPIATSGRNRTYQEALQYAIWHTQQNIRFNALKGTDGLGGKTITWTNPAAPPTSAELLANENYKQRILRYIVSDINITVNTNANHQLDFIFRTNLSPQSGTITGGFGTSSVLNNYLANANYFLPAGTLPFTAGTSGELTSSIQVNPWMQVGVQTGEPTHFLQVQITPPANVRFKSRTVQNCLDFYNLQYRQTLTTAGTANTQIIAGDCHATAAGARTEDAASGGNFTPYGLTWTGFPVSADRSDLFKDFSKQDGTDGWIPLAYWGVRQVANPNFNEQVVYMYAPLVYFAAGVPTKRLVYINDVDCNHNTNSPTISYGTLSLYPSSGVTDGDPAKSEMISSVFTGYSVFVTSAQIVSNALSSFGAANLIGNLYNLHPMDAESHPTFIVEIEMLGIGNHLKFTGSGECKRVKIIKRVPLSDTSYGGFLRANADAQEVADYGTCIGLSKVSTVKCRILNEKGEVLKLSQPDTFPPWTFSLCFEC